MSDTRIGRASVTSAHGLSRFGRRPARRDDHAAHLSRGGVADVAGLAEVTDLNDYADAAELARVTEVADLVESPTADGSLPVDLDRPALHAVESLDPAATVETAPGRPIEPTPLALPVGAGIGLAVALLTGAPVLAVLGLGVVWLLVALQSSSSRLLPGASVWPGLLPAATATVATAGIAVGVLDAPRSLVLAGLTQVAAASLAALVLRRLRRAPRRRIVVVGTGAEVAMAATRWLGHREAQVVGAVLTGDDELDLVVADLRVPVTRDADQLGDLLDRTGANLVVAGASADDATLRRTSWAVESRPVALALSAAIESVSPHRLQPTRFAGTTMTHVAPSRPTVAGRLVKSAWDRLAAVGLLVLFSPVIAALAVWIRLDSPGPVFFRQVRVGHHGRHFTMWKLRTMVVDAERIKDQLGEHNEGAGLLFKMQHDPRITRSGRILRKLSLDELPQLINVALGHMSLVGPRPALPSEVARYDAVTRRRLASKPGITGLWQVSGRSDLSWDESVRLDLHYTDNWRIRDDAAILFRTAGAVLNSRGAY